MGTIKRSSVAVAALAMLLAACGGESAAPAPAPAPGPAPTAPAAPALECDPYSLLVLDDDSHRVLTYALTEGIVTSDAIPSVEIEYVLIPALIAATGTDQYSVVQTALPGVVFANLGGADVRIIATGLAHTGGGMKVFTRKDSGIDTAADLKPGTTIGIASFGSTAAIQVQVALREIHGINAAYDGGDLDWVQLDPPSLLNAVLSGQIDAAVLWHTAGWLAMENDEIQIAVSVDDDYRTAAGDWPVGSAFTVLQDLIDREPECVLEFARMLSEAEEYAVANIDIIAPIVAEASGQPEAFIKYWWASGAYSMGARLDDEWTDRAEAFYVAATRNGLVPPASMGDLAFRG